MKAIETVTVWTKGSNKTAELLRLTSVYDNLEDKAVFLYELLETDGVDNPYVISDGNLSITSTDYSTWKSGTDTNNTAYTWAADQLNLVIT